MSYDYQVSDLSGAAAAMMSPNAPLYNPDPPALQMSINQTVHNCKCRDGSILEGLLRRV
jgi:hypothetical protein